MSEYLHINIIVNVCISVAAVYLTTLNRYLFQYWQVTYNYHYIEVLYNYGILQCTSDPPCIIQYLTL